MRRRTLVLLPLGLRRDIYCISPMVLLLLTSLFHPFLLRAQDVKPLDKKISYVADKLSLRDALKQLHTLSGLAITYNEEIVRDQPTTTLHVDGTARVVLEKILAPTNLAFFETTDGGVYISPRKNGKDPVKAAVFHQIKGVVMDPAGRLLAGASVQSSLDKTGTSTGDRGEFSMVVQQGTTLRFSYLGMRPKEHIVKNDLRLEIVLDSLQQQMAEMVITGYQHIDRRMLASSVVTLTPDKFLEPGAVSVDQMLQGKVAGLMVLNTSGSPNSTPKIRIRGTNTMLGDSKPLWVVDGIIREDPVNLSPLETASALQAAQESNFSLVGNAISGVNPNDIESLTFLKDASATAIYGVHAANGVIVVTTKKGKSGPTTLTYNTNMGFAARPRYTQINGLNSKERIDVSKEIWANGVYYQTQPLPASYEGLVQQLGQREITQAQFAEQVGKLETMNTDWLKLLAGNQFNQTHHLSFSGGSGKTTFYGSFGYSNAHGNFHGDDNRSYSVLLSLGANLNSRTSVSMILSGSYRKADGFFSSVNPSDYALRTSRALSADSPYVTSFSSSLGSLGTNPLHFSILNELAHTGNTNKTGSFAFTSSLNYNILPGLSYQATIGSTYNSNNAFIYADDRTWYIAQIRKYDFGAAPYGSYAQTHSPLPFGGIAWPSHFDNISYTIRNSLSYERNFFQNRDRLQLYVAQELRSTHAEGSASEELGYYPDRGQTYASAYYNAGSGVYAITGGQGHYVQQTNQTDNFLSAMATMSYSINRRYIINANIRTDGSNRFGQYSNQKFLPNWSVAGRWDVTNEPWLDKSNWLSGLSLRASYGTQGNVVTQVGPNLIASYPSSPIDNASGELVLDLKSLPYPELRWEKVQAWNLGSDWNLFNGRINLTAEVYRQHATNLLVTRNLPEEYGIPVMYENYGSMNNWGYEATLNIIPVRTKDFSWAQTFIFGKNFNEVAKVDIPGTADAYLGGTAIVKGKPINSFWSWSFAGLDHRYGYPTFNNIGHYLPGTTDPATYLHYSGVNEPIVNTGTTTTLRYKSLTMTLLFSVQLGATRRLYEIYYKDAYSVAPAPESNLVKEIKNRWRQPGDETKTTIPAYTNWAFEGGGVSKPGAQGIYSPYPLYDQSDARLYNGDFLRCRQVFLSYVLPARLVRPARVHGATVSLAVTNPFTIASSKLHGQDPEASTAGGGLALPMIRNYTATFNINF